MSSIKINLDELYGKIKETIKSHFPWNIVIPVLLGIIIPSIGVPYSIAITLFFFLVYITLLMVKTFKKFCTVLFVYIISLFLIISLSFILAPKFTSLYFHDYTKKIEDITVQDLSKSLKDYDTALNNSSPFLNFFIPTAKLRLELQNYIFNINEKKVMNGKYNLLALAPDSENFAALSLNKELLIGNFNDIGRLSRLKKENNDETKSISFSLDNKYIATGSKKGIIEIYDIKDLNKINKLGTFNSLGGEIQDLSFSFDGNYLISGTSKGISYLWNLNMKYKHNILEKPFRSLYHNKLKSGIESRKIYGVEVSKHHNIAITAGGDGNLKLWDYKNNTSIELLSTNASQKNLGISILKLAMSPNEDRLAVYRKNGIIETWKIEMNKITNKPSIRYLSQYNILENNNLDVNRNINDYFALSFNINKKSCESNKIENECQTSNIPILSFAYTLESEREAGKLKINLIKFYNLSNLSSQKKSSFPYPSSSLKISNIIYNQLDNAEELYFIDQFRKIHYHEISEIDSDKGKKVMRLKNAPKMVSTRIFPKNKESIQFVVLGSLGSNESQFQPQFLDASFSEIESPNTSKEEMKSIKFLYKSSQDVDNNIFEVENTLVSINKKGDIRFWNPINPPDLIGDELNNEDAEIKKIEITRDQKFIVVFSERSFKVYSSSYSRSKQENNPVFSSPTFPKESIRDVKISADGEYIAVLYSNNETHETELFLYGQDKEKKYTQRKIGRIPLIRNIIFKDNETIILSKFKSSIVEFYNSALDKTTDFDTTYNDGVSFVDVAKPKDSDILIATIGDNKIVNVWESNNNKNSKIFEHKVDDWFSEILSIDLSSDGKTLAIVGKDNEKNGLLMSLDVDSFDQLITKTCNLLQKYHDVSKLDLDAEVQKICLPRLQKKS